MQVLVEMGPGHPLGRASAECMASNRARTEELARQAGLADPAGLAWSLHLLVQGAIVADLEGDPRAAGRAKVIAALLLEDHRPWVPGPEGSVRVVRSWEGALPDAV